MSTSENSNKIDALITRYNEIDHLSDYLRAKPTSHRELPENNKIDMSCRVPKLWSKYGRFSDIPTHSFYYVHYTFL